MVSRVVNLGPDLITPWLQLPFDVRNTIENSHCSKIDNGARAQGLLLVPLKMTSSRLTPYLLIDVAIRSSPTNDGI